MGDVDSPGTGDTREVEAREYTRAEVCKKLHIAPRTLTRWLRTGKFPKPMRVGMWERWVEEQIVAWKRQLLEEAQKPDGYKS